VRMKRDSERATIQSVKSSIESASAEVAVAEAQKNSAEADLAAAQADTLITDRQLEELDILITYTEIKAPFAGMVTARSVEPGNLVSSNNRTDHSQPLFVISRVDRLRIRIPVPEADAPSITAGDQVQLQFPSFPPEAPLMATVSRRSGSLDPSSRTMIVEADIDNSDGRLLPGMFGQATITAAAKTTARLLPAQAIRFDETGRAYVYVVSSDQTVTVADVTVGADNGLSIQVLSGVEPGQRVIGPHLKRFTDGQKVSVLPN
jgi:HlyD family secretion protein